MNFNKTLPVLLLLFGEVLLIISFLYFGQNTQTDILVLNIIVSSLIYFITLSDIIFPFINLYDKSQKQIGSIGLRWFFTFLYQISAIGLMIYLNHINPVQFITQLLTQSILFFLFLISLFSTNSSLKKVGELYEEETINNSRINELKSLIKELRYNVESLNNIPREIILRINHLEENFKYISPSNNPIASDLEITLESEIKKLKRKISEAPLDAEAMLSIVIACESISKDRKNIYSI
jgi:hypothetical protein